MDTNRFSNLQFAKVRNVGQRYQTELKAAAPQQNSISKPNEALIYGGSFSLFAILTGVLITISKTRIIEKNKSLFNLERFNQVPCKKCQYFTGNFYLKCAVRPSEALTKKAINCSDYCSQDNNDSMDK